METKEFVLEDTIQQNTENDMFEINQTSTHDQSQTLQSNTFLDDIIAGLYQIQKGNFEELSASDRVSTVSKYLKTTNENTPIQRRITTIARKILTNDRSVKGDFESPIDAILTFRVILEKIYKISIAEFDTLYDTTWCHKVGLDYLVERLLEVADSQTTKECIYNKKRIVIRLCYPDYYKEHYKPLSDYELFFLKDSRVKADLVTNSTLMAIYSNEFADKPDATEGDSNSAEKIERKSRQHKAYNNGIDIDRWIYTAFNNVWNTLFRSTTEELFVALARYRKNSLGSTAKCLDVVMKRGLYPSPLDWYMWNSPEEFQVKHLQEYLTIRKQAKLPEVAYISDIEKAFENIKERNNEMSIER